MTDIPDKKLMFISTIGQYEKSKLVLLRPILLVLCISAITKPVFSVDQSTETLRTSIFNENWLKAVVSIEVLTSSDTASTSIGTGFLLLSPANHVMLVTAKHVVSNEDNAILKGLAYRFNNAAKRRG